MLDRTNRARRREAANNDEERLNMKQRLEAIDLIPDCFFGRDFDAEKAGGYLLAGKLFVLRRPHQLKKKEKKQVARIVQRLGEIVRESPDLNRAVVNLDGSQTSVGDRLHDDEWLNRHYAPPNSPYTVIEVRVDPRPDDGCLHLSDYDVNMIMGSRGSTRGNA